MQRKKKKRRLKKSVKRGCLGIIIFLLLLAVFLFFRCSPAKDFFFSKGEPIEEVVVLEPDSMDMAIADDVQRLIRRAMHIDTTMLAVDIYDLERNCYVYEYRSHRKLIPASCMEAIRC